MFYIIEGKNHIPIPLDGIKMQGASGQTKWYGDSATENDEIKKSISNCWQDVERRFFNKGESVIFRTPGIKSGLGKGNQGYAIPRVFSVRTSRGNKTMAWIDNFREGTGLDAGRVIYEPSHFNIQPKDKTMVLDEDSIETILFMLLYNPMMIKDGQPVGRTFMEDKEEEALKYEMAETKNAIIHYWLFTQGVGFYNDDVRVTTLCHAWGIPNTEKWGLPRKKQLLSEAIKKAESKNEVQYNMASFNETCQKLRDGSDTRDVEILALITKCINRKVIRYDEKEFRWNLLAVDGKPLKKLVTVPPQQTGMNRSVLKDYLVHHPEDVQQLFDSIADPGTDESSEEVVLLKYPLPDVITEEFVRDDMNYADMQRISKVFGKNALGATKEELIPFLIEKLVLQKIEIKWKLKEKKVTA
jgi:hypothetical protein